MTKDKTVEEEVIEVEVLDEEVVEDDTDVKGIEIYVELDEKGIYNFKATEGTSPLMLIGLLDYTKTIIIDSQLNSKE